MRQALAPALCLAACFWIPSVASAQLSGNYTVDPNGAGSRNYKSLHDAALAVTWTGIKGPVTFTVASGSYPRITLGPIRGVSKTNRVTFKAAKLHGVIMTADASKPAITIMRPQRLTTISGYTIDGFRFQRAGTSGKSHAVYGHQANLDIEIENCRFDATTIYIFWDYRAALVDARGWRIHHNRFLSTAGVDPSIYVTFVHGFEIHHNSFDCNGSAGAMRICTSTSLLRTRIYNNVIWGNVRDISNGVRGYQVSLECNSTDFVHNTVVQGTGRCLVVQGSFPMYNYVANNIFATTGYGPLIEVSYAKTKGLVTESNLFTAHPQGYLFYVKNSTGKPAKGTYKTIKDWQTASGTGQNSVYKDPKFVGALNFQLRDGSPAAGNARNSPAYVVDDFLGRKRPKFPTIGAYEGLPASLFITFGKGCPGTGGFTPEISYGGQLERGSTTFQVVVTKALGGLGVRALLAIGASNTTYRGVKLPYSFGGGCNMLVAPDVLVPTSIGGSGAGKGWTAVRVFLPSNISYKGREAHFQWAIADPKAKGIGAAMSNAATLKL